MTNDLFDRPSAKDQLLEEIQKRGYMKTSDVIKFGVANFSNRAERNMRQLAKEGKVRRLSEEDKDVMFGEIREDVWEVVRSCR